MSKLFFNMRGKLLNLGGGGGGGKTEYLLAGGLAVVIIGALALTIYTSMGGPDGRDDDAKVLPYMCDNCGHTWMVSRKEAHPEVDITVEPPPPEIREAPAVLPCPNCQQTQGHQSVTCANCGHVYTPLAYRHESIWATIQGRQSVVIKGKTYRLDQDVCPKCGK